MHHRLLRLNLSSKEKSQEIYEKNHLIFRSDVKLYKDDAEIKYSKTLDSCKIPQVNRLNSFVNNSLFFFSR